MKNLAMANFASSKDFAQAMGSSLARCLVFHAVTGIEMGLVTKSIKPWRD